MMLSAALDAARKASFSDHHHDAVEASLCRPSIEWVELLALVEIAFLQRRLELITAAVMRYANIFVQVEFVEKDGNPLQVTWSASKGRNHFVFCRPAATPLQAIAINRWLSLLDLYRQVGINPFPGTQTLNLSDQGEDDEITFCSNSKSSLLIPDSNYMSTKGYSVERNKFFSDTIAWRDRRDVVYWRGNTTGVRYGDLWDLPRVRLCEFAKSSRFARLFDVKIVDTGNMPEQEKLLLAASGLLSDFSDPRTLSEYKYHIDIDGNTNSWPGLMTKLLSGGLVFKVSSPFEYRQWYYHKLQPYVHYIPIKSDLSDLEEKVESFSSRLEEADRIARNGQDLAFSLSYEREVRAAAAQILNKSCRVYASSLENIQEISAAGDISASHIRSFVDSFYAEKHHDVHRDDLSFLKFFQICLVVGAFGSLTKAIYDRFDYRCKITVVPKNDSESDFSVRWMFDAENVPTFAFKDQRNDTRPGVLVSRWVSAVNLFKHVTGRSAFRGSVLLELGDSGHGYDCISFCNVNGENLIPDSYYLGSRGYAYARKEFQNPGCPWMQRKARLFWRGSTTGHFDQSVRNLPRVKLCQLALDIPCCDIKISDIVQLNPEDAREVGNLGIKGDYVPWQDLARYKFHLDIDGNTNSWPGLFLKLLSGGLVFKVKSAIGYQQWYYERLKPGVNIVEVRSDLSDLRELLNYYQTHDQEARNIAEQGRLLAMSMDFDSEVASATEVVSSFASSNSS